MTGEAFVNGDNDRERYDILIAEANARGWECFASTDGYGTRTSLFGLLPKEITLLSYEGAIRKLGLADETGKLRDGYRLMFDPSSGLAINYDGVFSDEIAATLKLMSIVGEDDGLSDVVRAQTIRAEGTASYRREVARTALSAIQQEQTSE